MHVHTIFTVDGTSFAELQASRGILTVSSRWERERASVGVDDDSHRGPQASGAISTIISRWDRERASVGVDDDSDRGLQDKFANAQARHKRELQENLEGALKYIYSTREELSQVFLHLTKASNELLSLNGGMPNRDYSALLEARDLLFRPVLVLQNHFPDAISNISKVCEMFGFDEALMECSGMRRDPLLMGSL